MAYADYIHCKVCDEKMIYDGHYRVRDELESRYGTDRLTCPKCVEAENRELQELLDEGRDIIMSLTSGTLTTLGVSEVAQWGRGLVDRINAKLKGGQ